MTEERNNFAPEIDPEGLLTQRKRMRRAFSRVGWAVVAVTLATNAVAFVLNLILSLLNEAQLTFVDRNLLYFNELMIAISFVAGALVLISMPSHGPRREGITVGKFLTYLCICFGIGWAGNLLGSVMLNIWNAFTGNEVTNQLVEVLTAVDSWQVAICTGILAPILEEFFFRKLIIDRTRRYGELASILVSAAFFGIFHQNFSQFFYAFGIGILLGYVYCRTGSYLTVTLLHVAFNVIMGVLPSIITPDILLFLEEFSQIESENIEAALALTEEYAKPLLIYSIYSFAQGVLSIVGVILLIVKRKKIYFEKNSLLSPEEQRKTAVLNVGVVAGFMLLIGLTVSTLFTA